jgi:hypothetical protein
MTIPESYILNKFFSYSGDPEHKKYENVYNAGCPICREGASWGSKKRLYYYPTSKSFYCFNCSRSWNALNWICEVSDSSPDEVFSEIKDDNISLDVFKKQPFSSRKRKELPSLPYDSINIFDSIQNVFYSKNKTFNIALEYSKSRRLDTAINKPQNLYISFNDFYHKNRLCIPFYDRDKKIIFYQTRALDNSNPKYLGKVGYEKSLFGIDKVDTDLEYIFIFEGPIDSMFVKNSVSAAGLTLNPLQKKQLLEYPFHKKIWVLDNPMFDKTAKEKTKDLLEKGENVFMWTPNMKYKDFNDLAVKEKLDEVDYNTILDSIF